MPLKTGIADLHSVGGLLKGDPFLKEICISVAILKLI